MLAGAAVAAVLFDAAVVAGPAPPAVVEVPATVVLVSVVTVDALAAFFLPPPPPHAPRSTTAATATARARLTSRPSTSGPLVVGSGVELRAQGGDDRRGDAGPVEAEVGEDLGGLGLGDVVVGRAED